MTICEKADFFDEGAASIADHFSSYEPFFPHFRKINSDNFAAGRIPTKDVFTFLYYDMPAEGKTPDAAVFVNISCEWLLDKIRRIDRGIGNELYIIGNDGAVMLTYGTHLKEKDLELLNQNILSQENYHQGYFSQIIESENVLISYIQSTEYPWRYVSIAPYDNVIGEVRQTTSAPISIGFAILFLGLALSGIVSRKISIPFRDIQGKLQFMQNEKIFHIDKCKHDFLKSLLLERMSKEDISIEKRLDYFCLNLRSNAPLVLIPATIDGYRHCFDKISADKNEKIEQSMTRFLTLSKEKFLAEAIDMGHGNIAILLQTTDKIAGDFKNKLGLV